jgi:hypothetical protein
MIGSAGRFRPDSRTSALAAPARAEHQDFAKRLAAGPLLAGHGLIDDADSGGPALVFDREETAAVEANPERLEVMPRNAAPVSDAVKRAAQQRPAGDDVGQGNAGLERDGDGRGHRQNAGQTLDALLRFVDQLRDGCGLFVTRRADGHLDGQHVFSRESPIDGVHCHEGADQ